MLLTGFYMMKTVALILILLVILDQFFPDSHWDVLKNKQTKKAKYYPFHWYKYFFSCFPMS